MATQTDTQPFDKNQLQDLQEVFDSIDTNKNGRIELDELLAAMKRIDPFVAINDLEGFFKNVHSKDKHILDFDEFVALISKYIPSRESFEKVADPVEERPPEDVAEVNHLREWCDCSAQYINPMGTNPVQRWPVHNFISNDERVLETITKKKGVNIIPREFLRAGPRHVLAFDPSSVRAAIVTCGGLCPGINNVIRELVLTLKCTYGASVIYGIQFGYRGFWANEWLELTPKTVENVHNLGGTFLGSSRGGFDLNKIVDSLVQKNINQVYIIGGDGTHRGALAISNEIKRRALKIAVACIPKTIDNDFQIIDRSFGFLTAVEEAQRAIKSAKVEACGAVNGIGIVKLMGRQSGFIAMAASLASGDVDYCLIPEVPFHLPTLLKHMKHRLLSSEPNVVLVVAEGAADRVVGATNEKDMSGNPVLADVGKFLKTEISSYFKAQNIEVSIKYIDPTYMIRSVPPIATDSIYCSVLAQGAVHGAMAGFTDFTVGPVNTHYVYLPIRAVGLLPKTVDPNGKMWFRLMTATGQPNFSYVSTVFINLIEDIKQQGTK